MIFKPKLRSSEFEYHLHEFGEKAIESDKIYSLTEELVNLAPPTYEDEFDKRWEYFYLPALEDLSKGRRKLIAIPVWILEYNKQFYVTVQSYGRFNINKGDKKTEKFYYKVISEIIKFVPIVKKNKKILDKLIPYYIRRGKIKGKYVLVKILPQSEKIRILKEYEKRNKEPIKDISLNEYLEVASICYKAANKEELEKSNYDLSPIEMYKKWADGRDGGMLSIKDWNSKGEFAAWLRSGIWAGSHPFEIVFSWREHGIHLYPPREDSEEYYTIRVTNYAYAWDFIEMVEALIVKNISFEARYIENVLDYLAGDTYFSVNTREDHNLFYGDSKEEKKIYFPHIEWDEIKVVKYK